MATNGTWLNAVANETAQTLKLAQMNVEELKAEISRQQALHIADVMRCFKSDPCASDYQKNYKETEQYLWELIEKDGSVLGGLISAMERHLEK